MEAALSLQVQRRSMMRIFLSQHKWKNGPPTEEEATMMLNQGDDSAIPVPGVFMFVPGMPVVVNRNTHQGLKQLNPRSLIAEVPVAFLLPARQQVASGNILVAITTIKFQLKLVNGASYTGLEVILDKAYPEYRISADTMIHFGPPAGIILESETTKDVHFVGMPPGTMLLTPVSVMIRRQRSRPWQQKDCDPYSLYVQLSRCRSLDGIMLISKVRERDLVGNRVPQEMTAAQGRLEEMSTRTVEEAQRWLGEDVQMQSNWQKQLTNREPRNYSQ
ncbi:hypothetical protein H633G_11199 [Metarhizium anisopliae BRIP 53284]|nr:hypothetical protein H633G_11199 [Metarhizium anisopliae BRIP 53284]